MGITRVAAGATYQGLLADSREVAFSQQMSRARAVLGSPQSAAAAAAIGFDRARVELCGASLSSALRRIDVEPLKRAGVQPIAVFDFDNTLMRGDVLEVFLRMLLAERALDPLARAPLIRFARTLGGIPATRPEDDQHVLLRRCLDRIHRGGIPPNVGWQVAIAAFTGMPFTRAQAMARRLFASGCAGEGPYRSRTFAQSTAILGALRSRGVEPFIVTAGCAFLARAGAAHLGIGPHRVFGAELEVDPQGRCTGRAPDIAMVGKDRVVSRAIGVPPLFVFGDSLRMDGPMMHLALIQSFMVNPKDEFVGAMRDAGRDYCSLSM
jgi:phosphoserine phosphatase